MTIRDELICPKCNSPEHSVEGLGGIEGTSTYIGKNGVVSYREYTYTCAKCKYCYSLIWCPTCKKLQEFPDGCIKCGFKFDAFVKSIW